MIGPGPQCYIPSSVEISPPVPEKKILRGFTIYGHGSHLGHVTSIMLLNFHFHVLKSLHTKFGQKGPVVFEKSKFQFSYVNDLGSRSRNDLYLQYSHTLINSISCLHLPTFKSQAAIAFEKIHCFHIFL